MFDSIRERYDPENDAHKVTWAEIQLANALDAALGDIRALLTRVAALEDQLQRVDALEAQGSYEEYRLTSSTAA